MNDAAASTVNESPDNAPIQPSAELVLTSVPGPNKALVDRAISELREKLVEAVARAALDVGQFLLELFFGGDPARYLDRKKDGDPSFEALLDDPRLKELGLSRTKLYDCIGVHIQRQVLGTEAVMRLQFSHQVALLRAPDERREELLEEAAEKIQSVRTLRERVGEARREEYGESKGGRPTCAIPRTARTFIPRSVRAITAGREPLQDSYEGRWGRTSRRSSSSLSSSGSWRSGRSTVTDSGSCRARRIAAWRPA